MVFIQHFLFSRKVIFLSVFLFLFAGISFAQTKFSIPDTTQKDITDVLPFLKKKQDSAKENKKYQFAFVPAIGLSQQTGFAGVFSGNVAFYSDTAQQYKRTSSILSSITYSQYKQTIFPIQSDIWTKNNKYNIITDWRYLNYPSTTFGLGGKTKITDGYTIDFSYLKIHQVIMKRITSDLYAGLGYYFDYFWNVRQVPDTIVTSFDKYGFPKQVIASGPAFRVIYDSRQNPINPTDGWYANIVYRPNYTFLRSDNNWQSLLLEFRKYFILSEYSKNVLAFWSYNWFTVGKNKPPYLLLPSTGWDDFYNTGRGYIQGRFRSRNMIYLESEYRFRVTNNGLLGGVVFANAESFSKDFAASINNITIAPAAGLGIRIKFNKYSRTNLCIDYGWGVQGSHGIQVNLGEVF